MLQQIRKQIRTGMVSGGSEVHKKCTKMHKDAQKTGCGAVLCPSNPFTPHYAQATTTWRGPV